MKDYSTAIKIATIVINILKQHRYQNCNYTIDGAK